MEVPDRVIAGALVLKRWEPAWADEATAAVRESLPELAPFLPWATEAYDVDATRTFIRTSAEEWDRGSTFNYAIFTLPGDLVGGIGLMTRMGPGVLEIGYWMRTAYTRRGHMTAAVTALTGVALALPGVERVAIRHDATNAASAAVAAKAGFAEVNRVQREPEAPGETGTEVIRERRAPNNRAALAVDPKALSGRRGDDGGWSPQVTSAGGETVADGMGEAADGVGEGGDGVGFLGTGAGVEQ